MRTQFNYAHVTCKKSKIWGFLIKYLTWKHPLKTILMTKTPYFSAIHSYFNKLLHQDP